MLTPGQKETIRCASPMPLAVGIVTLDIASYVYPLLELAEQLAEMGYSVTFLCPTDGLSVVVKARGFSFLRIENSSEILPATGIQSPEGNALANFVTDERPMALFVMAEMHEHIISLLAISAAVIITDTHLATRYRPGIPPPDVSYLPSQSKRSNWICIYHWQILRARRFLGRNLRRIRQGRVERIRKLELHAKRLNLDSSALFDLSQWHFIDYRNLPLLRLATPALDFQLEPEPGSIYTGAMVRSTAHSNASNECDSDWLSFVNGEKAAQRQVLLVCLGSFQSSEELLKKVIAATRGEAWSALLVTGPDCSPALLGALPDNVRAYNWLPQMEVLEWADGMVCAGGNATINECIIRSVPMLCYPLNRMDQYGMAARVVYHGLGSRGDIHQDSVATIRLNIQSLLQDSCHATAITKMQKQFDAFCDANPIREAINKALAEANHAP